MGTIHRIYQYNKYNYDVHSDEEDNYYISNHRTGKVYAVGQKVEILTPNTFKIQNRKTLEWELYIDGYIRAAGKTVNLLANGDYYYQDNNGVIHIKRAGEEIETIEGKKDEEQH